jgi:hypothetical protein
MNHGIPAAKSGPSVLPGSHAQRRQIRDRAVERAAEALPAASNTGNAERPGRDHVADRLALVLELLDGLDLALEPGPDVDAELPALVRLQRDCIGHRVSVQPPGAREPEPRRQVASRVDDRESAAVAVESCGRGRWERLRMFRVAE